MENIPEYIARMHGRKQVTYHHSSLEPILGDTYGILVYQEQIIRIAADLAGYAPGDADTMRKAVGKKKKDLMDKHRALFIEGANGRGIAQEQCEAIWADIEYFARYGFNKSHAADYAVITCQTAFLKAHYPVEYMAALLSVERDNTEKVAQYLVDARRMGIQVAPPAISRAELDFTIEGDNRQPVIRYGLGAIKNAGAGAIELILQERQANGSFAGLADFCERVDLRRVGKRALESMVKVGVFDEWGSRPRLLEAIDRLISHSGSSHEAASAGQMSLFGALSGLNANVGVELLKPESALPKVDPREVLSWEKELIGVYLSEHPISRLVGLLQDVAKTTTADLEEMVNGRGVTLAGVITSVRGLTTKKGEAMAFAMLEDLRGAVELLFFPRTWKECRDKVKIDQVLLVRGKVQLDNGDARRAKVVVDGVDNNPTVARAASAEDEYGQPPGAGYAGLPIALEPEPYYEVEAHDNGASFVPPPPPNFEEEDGAYVTAVVEEAAESGSRIGENVVVAPAPTQESPPATAAPANGVAANGGRPQGNGASSRLVVVEVQPVAGWRDTFRQTLQAALRYDGGDCLAVSLRGQELVMDFPGRNTLFCPELINDLKHLPGVVDVYVCSPG
jgi:DNA polymerase-3 subunit alpha